MSDITNYAYVWYTRDASQITEDDLDKIYEIVLNYSYPCYLSGSEVITRLTPEEKTKLLQHELSFIEEKMEMAGLSHIIMMQIPRVLYDLLNLYFTFNHTNADVMNTKFVYRCSAAIAKMSDYNTLTRKYTDSVKGNIFALNAFIVNYIQEKYSMSNIRGSYDKIANELVAQCWLIPENYISLSVFHNTSLEEAKNIVRQTIHFEKQYSQGYAILYRGARSTMDSLIVGSRYSFKSLSFNLSIFTGCVMDVGACTMSYFAALNGNDKIKINVKKFFLHDLSSENSLFFIPPIHPYVQVYSSGELFHCRTKIGIDYDVELEKVIASGAYRREIVTGLFSCMPTEKEFVEKCDYLTSDKTFEELNALYKRYQSTGVVGTWSSNAAIQSKQEQIMEARAANVKEVALTSPEKIKELKKVSLIVNQRKPIKEISSETKFKLIDDYYPYLVSRFRFMISNFISEYLYSICPQASFKVSYKYKQQPGHYHNIDYPSATFEFESKDDFEKCQSDLPTSMLKFDDTTSLISTSTRRSHPPPSSPPHQPSATTLASALTYNSKILHPGKVETLFDSSRTTLPRYSKLFEEHRKIVYMRSMIMDIGYFLGQHLFIQQRRDDNIKYKDNLDIYFKFMGEIFPKLQGQGPFPSPTRKIPLHAPDAHPNETLALLHFINPQQQQQQQPPSKSPAKKTRLTFAEQAFKEMSKDGDEYGGGKKRTIRKKNRKGTRTTIRKIIKRQRKNRTRTVRKKSRKFGER